MNIETYNLFLASLVLGAQIWFLFLLVTILFNKKPRKMMLC